MLDFVNLKPTESQFKVGIIVAADRMNEQAANAFLKTLEEPPAQSVLILLTTDPTRLLETILSRCLRLTFGGTGPVQPAPADLEWLGAFASLAAEGHKTLFGRYRLLDLLLRRLSELRQQIESDLKRRSPLEKYPDADQALRDQWEEELKAAIEAEYRRQRADTLALVQQWLREVWLHALFAHSASSAARPHSSHKDLLALPEASGAAQVAQRLKPGEAADNLELIEELQRWLHTNVQEALALEVTLLKLHL
jgi:DNA polymerase-3 subunit delta'